MLAIYRNVYRQKFWTFLIVSLFSPHLLADKISGELITWHTVTVSFSGPETSENYPSTFLNNRLTVTFSQGDHRYVVPGYFAGDGRADKTHATSGDQWQVKFTPDRAGEWQYQADFVVGNNVAINDKIKGKKFPLKKAQGSFTVTELAKISTSASKVNPLDIQLAKPLNKQDFRHHGRLSYVGKHHLQFQGSKKYFLKAGAGSPENLLAFDGFDGTWDAAKCPEFPSLGDDQLHHYQPHRQHWQSTDNYWTNEKGQDNKGLFGLINYMAEQGLNSFYLMSLTYQGDGCDVWPWVNPANQTTFDVSKLAQWNAFFDHMQKNGVHIHFFLTETENENIFELADGTEFSDIRKLYYREMIARFAHHLALSWNLGEENGWTDEKGKNAGIGNTDQQRQLFMAYIDQLDAYDHPMKIHEIDITEIYPQLAGFEHFDGPALQRHNNYNEIIQHFINMSKKSGHPWLVSMDEPLGWEFGLKPDAQDPDHDIPRQEVLWGSYMAGSSGVEWYFGWQNNAPTSDLSSEDLTVREKMWQQNKIAHQFFQQYIPFYDMTANNALIKGDDDYVFVKENELYLVYLKKGGEALLDLTQATGQFTLSWFNPRTGGELQHTQVKQLNGGKIVSLGLPPSDNNKDNNNKDWAALIKRTN